MAKEKEVDYDAEIAKLKKSQEAKKVAEKKAEDKRLAIRATRIKKNEKAQEAKRQQRAHQIKGMTAIVGKAQTVIGINGGGPREEALLKAIVEYASPVVVVKEEAKKED